MSDLYAGIVFGFLSPARQREILEQRAESERRAAEREFQRGAKDWSDALPWEPQLALTASSWMAAVQPWVDGLGLAPVRKLEMHPKQSRVAGDFFLCNRVLPRGAWLSTIKGKAKGCVCFDGDVVTPILALKRPWNDIDTVMGLTPMECWTLRAGTRFAKGRVVVAGLGLGWQLVQVARRKQVRSVVVVERHQEVIDLVWPFVEPMLPQGKVKLRVGDAREVVPNLACDVVLSDIDYGYGSNRFPPCPKAKHVWVWGSAVT